MPRPPHQPALPIPKTPLPPETLGPGELGTPRALPLRLVQLVLGCAILGVGLGLLLRARLGMDPFGMLLEGVAERTGLSFGLTNLVLGVILALLCWRPGGVRPGLGTLTLPVVVGPAADLTLWLVSTPTTLPGQLALALAGATLTGIGAGIYLGANLGAGPFDSVPFALRNHWPTRSLGTLYALALAITLVLGVLAGGQAGVMTVVLVAALGSLVSRVRTRTLTRPHLPPSPPTSSEPELS